MGGGRERREGEAGEMELRITRAPLPDAPTHPPSALDTSLLAL